MGFDGSENWQHGLLAQSSHEKGRTSGTVTVNLTQHEKRKVVC